MDIGANLGYFCHRAEELGYDVLAVESCPKLAYVMRKLKHAENRRFRILCDSILDHPFDETLDVVLALNVFHHFIKKERTHRKFVGMLGRMKARQMIFQSHTHGEKQMVGAYRNYQPEQFVSFILRHSRFNASEYLDCSERGRPIYRLWTAPSSVRGIGAANALCR
jgi:2-polyprenyl-3-methyl-5-hydroxy-6-metoxy-1,4-benzoquinol methylase